MFWDDALSKFTMLETHPTITSGRLKPHSVTKWECLKCICSSSFCTTHHVLACIAHYSVLACVLHCYLLCCTSHDMTCRQ